MFVPSARRCLGNNELGAVQHRGDHFRAHVQYRSGESKAHLYGPDRRHRHRAQTDLEDMRAAGAVGSTREKGLEIKFYKYYYYSVWKELRI